MKPLNQTLLDQRLFDLRGAPKDGAPVLMDGILPDRRELLRGLREDGWALVNNAIELRALIRSSQTRFPQFFDFDPHLIKHICPTDYPRMPHFGANPEFYVSKLGSGYRGLFFAPNRLIFGREFECCESPNSAEVTDERIPFRQVLYWVRNGYNAATLFADLEHAHAILNRRAEEAWGELGDQGRWDVES